MTQLTDRLAASDPAADADPAPPEHLLHRLLAEPAARPGSRRTARRLVLPAAGLASAAVAAVVLLPGGGGPSLAERAYAATATDGVVLHQVRTTTLVADNPNIPPALKTTSSTLERWQRGDDARTLLQEGGTRVEVVLADGRMVRNDQNGRTESADPQLVAMNRAIVEEDPLTTFREAYTGRRLTETGAVAFAGRTARRFVSEEERAVGTEATDVIAWEWFVDPATAEPLGSRQTYRILEPSGVERTRDVITTTVDRFDRLAPTAEALAQLREGGA